MFLYLRLLFTFCLWFCLTPSVATELEGQNQWSQFQYKTPQSKTSSPNKDRDVASVEEIEKIGLAELELDFDTAYKGNISIDYNLFLPIVQSPLVGLVSCELFYFEKKLLKQNRAKYLVFQTLKIPLC